MIQKDIVALTAAAGLFFDTWAPGDGTTRYRFFEQSTDYFAADGLATFLGARDAAIWIRGFFVCLCLERSQVRAAARADRERT